jgi:hypothetical protein
MVAASGLFYFCILRHFGFFYSRCNSARLFSSPLKNSGYCPWFFNGRLGIGLQELALRLTNQSERGQQGLRRDLQDGLPPPQALNLRVARKTADP